jgi:hypothetical protein
MAESDAAAAAERLEAAVDRLAAALARRPEPAPATDGLPQAEIATLSARLDATLGRLRGALGEAAAARAVGEEG